MAEQQGDDDRLGQQRGGQVGAGGALAMGALLAMAAHSNAALVACVAAATGVVAVFAHWLGRTVGQRIARGSIVTALGWGLLSGLACLGCAAFCAGVLGMIWAAHDGFADPFLLHNYLRKPVLAVGMYGLMPATLWGLLCGIVLWRLTRRRRAVSDA